MKQLAATLALAAALVAAAGCNSSTITTPPGGVAVNIITNAATKGAQAFSPNPVSLPAGGTVIWTNRDGIPHTVTSDTGAFDSGTIPPGGTWPHTFASAGTFPYHCTMSGHSMSGSVVVTQSMGTY